jgi:hypothetical protein
VLARRGSAVGIERARGKIIVARVASFRVTAQRCATKVRRCASQGKNRACGARARVNRPLRSERVALGWF